jgi:hypothetical protein
MTNELSTRENEPTTTAPPKVFIVSVPVKRPGLMAALSLIIPGLGQIGCAQDNKGVFLMGMALLGFWLTGGIATILISLLSSVDAFFVGRAILGGSVLRKWDFFPGISLIEKLPARTIPLIIVLVILALMTIRIVTFANGYVAEN